MTTLVPARWSYPDVVRRLDAVLGGPVWWACHLGGSYWLVPRLCRWGTLWPLHVLSIVLLLLIARALLSGVQVLRAGTAAGDGHGAGRDVFLGWVGISLSLLFAGVTVAEWLQASFHDPCW